MPYMIIGETVYYFYECWLIAVTTAAKSTVSQSVFPFVASFLCHKTANQ